MKIRAAFEQQHDAASTLSLAAAHLVDFPDGRWWRERETYAVLALVALERRDEANVRAARLFDRAPRTQHRARIEAALRR